MAARAHEEYFNLPLAVDEATGTVVKTFVLVIYDIVDNKRRTYLAQLLSGFGYRVQDSAFEAMLTKSQLARLLTKIERFATAEDNIRIYKIKGDAAVTFYGEGRLVSADDFFFL